MQSLEEISSNQDKILKQVSLAISNVSRELSLLTDEINLQNVIKVYKDTLKLLSNFRGICIETLTSDLMIPLFRVIKSAYCKGYEDDLVVILSVAIYQNLLNPKTYPSTISLLKDSETIETIRILVGGTNGGPPTGSRGFNQESIPYDNNHDDGNEVLKINDLGFFTLFQDIRFNSNIIAASRNFVNVLVWDFQTIFLPLCTLENTLSEPEYDIRIVDSQLAKLAELLVDNRYRDLIGIMIINSPNLLETLIGSNSLATYPIQVIFGNLIEIFNCEFFSTLIRTRPVFFTKIDNASVLKFPTLTTSNKNLEIAMKLALEILDHELSSFPNLKTMLVYINWSLNQIISYSELPYGKLNIYSAFNKLKPKLSFISFLKLQNYQLVSMLNSTTNNVDYPNRLTDHLTVFKLPPLSKSNCLLDNLKWSNLDSDLVPDSTGELELNAIIKNLKLVSMFSQDDFIIDSTTEEFTDLNKKLILRKIDSLLSHQLLTLLTIENLSINPLSKDFITYFIVEALTNALSTEIPIMANTPNLILMHLIAFSEDLSLLDVRFVRIFNNLYEKLINFSHTRQMFEDPYISSQISNFLQTFGDDGVSTLSNLYNLVNMTPSTTLVSLAPDDYNFIDDHEQY